MSRAWDSLSDEGKAVVSVFILILEAFLLWG